jgi:hypothetical protein
MKQAYNSIYVKEYYEGYSLGIDPFSATNSVQNSEAIVAGFQSGRSEYERMNGFLSAGIPNRILNDKVLEDYLLAGMLGMSIDTLGYTPYQINTIVVWYLSGVEKYEPLQFEPLFGLIEDLEIELIK